MKTTENLLISQDEIDRIYTGELTLYLWRSLHKKAKVKIPFIQILTPARFVQVSYERLM